jgi:hypothetical protein
VGSPLVHNNYWDGAEILRIGLGYNRVYYIKSGGYKDAYQRNQIALDKHLKVWYTDKNSRNPASSPRIPAIWPPLDLRGGSVAFATEYLWRDRGAVYAEGSTLSH